MSSRMAFFTLCVAAVCLPAAAQTIEGDVLDGDTGQGIPGARVRLSLDDTAPMFTVADGAGHFRFSGLTGKSYIISARQIGYMEPDGRPNTSGGGNSVQPGQADPVRIVLIRYAVIAGTITDTNGAPVQTCQVTLLRKTAAQQRLFQRPERRLPDDANLEVIGTANTDERGTYRLWRVRAGTYYLAAAPPLGGMLDDDRRMERTTYYGGSTDFSGAKPIEAVAGRTMPNVNIEILQRAGVRVSGRIVKAAGRQRGPDAVHTAVLMQSLSSESPSWQYATMNGDQFEIKDVLPGKYALAGVMGDASHGAMSSELAASVQTIEVDQADISGLTVAPQPPHDLPGLVRLDERCHPWPVRLLVRRSFMNFRSDVVANADGSFVLKNLLPSQYLLDAFIPREGFATVAAVRLGGRESKSGFIMDAQDYGPLVIEMTCAQGRISGEVRDASGKPATSAMIAVFAPGETEAHPIVNVTPDTGTFDVSVRPGEYEVMVCSAPVSNPRYSKECQTAAGPITIKDGTHSQLVLTAPAAPRKEGLQ